MNNWIKNPKYNQDPQISSDITNSKGQSSENTVFCFKHIDKDYDVENLCGPKTNNKFTKSFIKKLQKISQITLSEVQGDDRKGFGYELLKIEQLKKRIPHSVTIDIQQLNVFVFGGDGRIVGYYNKNIFHILFIDTHLKIYNHGS